MTWEWSHTNEAYRDAEINLQNLPHAILAEIYAEWKHWDGDTFNAQLNETYDGMSYDETLSYAKTVRPDHLAELIWILASDHETGRNCDNGGHLAHMCPFGCDVHKVAFSR